MNIHRKRLIIISFICSVLAALTNITSLILRIINDLIGFNLSYFYPSCNEVYFNAKFGYSYLSVLVEFVANVVALVGSALLVGLLLMPLRKICCNDQNQDGDEDKQTGYQTGVRYEAIFIAAALTTVCEVVIMGGTIQYMIQGNTCSGLINYTNTILNYANLGTGGITFILLILILILLCQRQQLTQEITMNFLRKNDDKKSEQEQIVRRVEEEARGYLDFMAKDKDNTVKGLLSYQQQIYKQMNYQPRPLDQTWANKIEEQSQSEYEYEYEEVDEQEEEEEVEEAVLMAILNEGIRMVEQKEWVDENNEDQFWWYKDPKLDDLQKSSKNVNLGDKSLTVKNLKMLRKYSSGRMSPDKIREQDEQDDSQQGRGENQNHSQLSRQSEKANQQMKKILKVMLYKNLTHKHSKQREVVEDLCPIRKYLQKDEKYQLNQSDYKFKDKNRKNLYQKQQLIFSKKRKDIGDKNAYRSQFDQVSVIKAERLQRFGDQWVKMREEEEQNRLKEVSDRFKKRNGLEAIRSKYCD